MLYIHTFFYDMFKFYLINNSLNFNVPKVYIFPLEKLYIYFTLNLIKNAIRRNKKNMKKKIMLLLALFSSIKRYLNLVLHSVLK